MSAAKDGLARPITKKEFARKVGGNSFGIVPNDLWVVCSPLGGALEVLWGSQEHIFCEILLNYKKPELAKYRARVHPHLFFEAALSLDRLNVVEAYALRDSEFLPYLRALIPANPRRRDFLNFKVLQAAAMVARAAAHAVIAEI